MARFRKRWRSRRRPSGKKNQWWWLKWLGIVAAGTILGSWIKPSVDPMMTETTTDPTTGEIIKKLRWLP